MKNCMYDCEFYLLLVNAAMVDKSFGSSRELTSGYDAELLRYRNVTLTLS